MGGLDVSTSVGELGSALATNGSHPLFLPPNAGSTPLSAPAAFCRSFEIFASSTRPTVLLGSPECPPHPVTLSISSRLNSELEAPLLPRSSPSLRPGSTGEYYVLGLGLEASAAMLLSGGAFQRKGRRLISVREFRALCASAEVCWPRV